MIRLLMTWFFILFPHLRNSNVNQVRLEKVEDKSQFEQFCETICPYVIFLGCLVLAALIFIALVRYGHMLSTEANNYYYNMG